MAKGNAAAGRTPDGILHTRFNAIIPRRVSTHSMQIIVDKSTFAYLNRSLEHVSRPTGMKQFLGGRGDDV